MTIGFETAVRPLFRDRDRYEMDFVFDLWSYADVKAHAGSILERLVDGTMPCDARWPQESVALFRSWIDGGCAP